jgi:hypothetical protein
MTLLNVRQTKVGGFEEALPSSCISKTRIADSWLRRPLALGCILEKEEKPLGGANVGDGCCMLLIAWLVNILSNMQIRGSPLSEAERELMNADI